VADVQIVVVDGPNAGREFELSGSTVVGRDQSAGLVIDDAEASRRHASLSVEGTTVTVEDLGSTNGTFVNGARISAPKELTGGDKLRIGTTVFELRVPQAEEPPAAEPDVSDQATRMGTALPDLDELQATAPRQVPDFAKEPEPPAAEPEPPTPEPVAPEPIQPTAAGIPQPPAPTNAPPPSSGPPGGAGGPPGGEPAAPPPPSAPPPAAPPPAAGPPPSAPPPPAAAPPPPVGAPTGAYSPAPYGGGAVSTSNYPINVEADYPQGGITNWRPLVQWILAFPHFVVLYLLAIAGFFAYVGAWFGVLLTGRHPPGIFNFLAGASRWSNRVTGYAYGMTEQYPPFSLEDDPYPIRTRFDYPEGGIARWRALAHIFLAIPHYVVLYLLNIAANVAILLSVLAVLFTGQYPPATFDFITGVMRWRTRVIGYICLMTEEYPPFSLE
jgi:pSer/pThr/pTyr-binding forkhead associated (FHA) protein